jgi:hypothetical protein
VLLDEAAAPPVPPVPLDAVVLLSCPDECSLPPVSEPPQPMTRMPRRMLIPTLVFIKAFSP